MAMHGLKSVTIGVPNVEETIAYYGDFGLRHLGQGRFATLDGGEQFRIATAETRRVLTLEIGADHDDDLARVRHRLHRRTITADTGPGSVGAVEPVTGVAVTLTVAPRIEQAPRQALTYNGPGTLTRLTQRSPAIEREYRVRPRKLGHVVIGTPDYEATRHFFTDVFGLKISDEVGDHAVFLRCSTDHHNVLVQRAPVGFLHHTSWQVDDVDDVGRAATRMLEGHPERHVWGLGRHHLGSNFFWYLRDPAGNFSEYYSDMDAIVEDQLWKPEVWEGMQSLYNWGPPPPPSFLHPEDLAALMTGAHHPG